jgi:hypothetical protein
MNKNYNTKRLNFLQKTKENGDFDGIWGIIPRCYLYENLFQQVILFIL